MMRRKHLMLFTLFAVNLVDQPTPEVKIDQGILTGKISTDGTFYEYHGIPYAIADISNRFQAPKPPPSWKGVFKAVDEFYKCPQPTSLGVIGTEDCLKINVYVPITAKKSLPVMVYIHGGAFMLGSGGKYLLGPEFLVKRDIILVTLNYRLGILGFLSLNIKEAPGNAGLKDQIAALRWVKRNIAAFGGDPNNVTIFGHSAGAVSVAILLVSEGTEGLFNKAIVQSGSSLTDFAIKHNSVEVASIVAKELGYDTKDPLELYKIFSNKHFKDLIGATAHKSLDQMISEGLLQLPCVEKKFPGIEAVMYDLPYNLINKNIRNISVIYGATNREGLFFIGEKNEKHLHQMNDKYIFGNDLEFKSKDEAKMVNERIKDFYFGKEEISRSNIMNLSDVYSHMYFEMPAIIESVMMVKRNNSPIFNYYFSYAGSRNMIKEHSGFANEAGACHGDDILYLFNAYILPYRVKSKDQIIVDWMTKMWTNFAKYGHPTPESDPELQIRWKPSSYDDINFLHINDELKMGPILNPGAYQLWNDIYLKYRKINIHY